MNNNEFITMFENELSKFTGAPYVVLTDSCTNAIFLSLVHYYKDTLIIIPEKTYLSVPQSIIHSGNNVEFENIVWDKKYNLKNTNIWDCAVGLEPNMYESNTVQCLSFQQKKCINIGKGGAILLDNLEDYKILKRLSHDGRDSSIPVEDDKGVILGYHMNMIPEQAVKGVLLLNQLSEYNIKHNLKNSSHYHNIRNIFKGNE